MSIEKEIVNISSTQIQNTHAHSPKEHEEHKHSRAQSVGKVPSEYQAATHRAILQGKEDAKTFSRVENTEGQ